MKKYRNTFLLCLVLAVILGSFLYANTAGADSKQAFRGRVLAVDNSDVIRTGITAAGFQRIHVTLLNGPQKDTRIEMSNTLLGKAELDTYCNEGDVILVGADKDQTGSMRYAVLSLDRSSWLVGLSALFVMLLIGYAWTIGIKALLSFLLSVWVLWSVLIQGLLDGNEPLPLTVWVIVLLSAIILFSVSGFTKKGLAAFIGTLAGLGVTLVLTQLFGKGLRLSGLTMPYAQSLLFSGNMHLNMQDIFFGAVVLGASGAAMDIAMDVAASMEELHHKRPDMTMKELTLSGIRIGRHVIGTMSTTLLLAYSGGFLTLLMLFMTKNTDFLRIVNLSIVAAEIARTLIGSIGLILAAPLTAIMAGWLYVKAPARLSKNQLDGATSFVSDKETEASIS